MSSSPESTGSGFGIEVRNGSEVPVVVLHGELDIAAGPECRLALEPIVTEGKSLILDITDLSFIDSTGLSIFAKAHRILALAGQVLVLVAPQPTPLRVLTVTGLDQAVPICDSEEEAVRLALQHTPCHSGTAERA